VLQAQWTAEGIGLAELDPPPLRPGWVRLRVLACGICGSDVHALHGSLERTCGLTPGHEIAATPLDGPAGRSELYVVEPRLACGSCDFCKAGKRHLCPRGGLIGVTLDGGLAETLDCPPEVLHTVSAGIEPACAALAEPLAVCVRGIHRARISTSSCVLVLGAGTVGLLAGLLARDRAARVAVSARYPHQRHAAERLGLTALDEASVDAWAEGSAPDVVIETVGGHASTLATALRACRPGGRVVVLGLFGGPVALDARALVEKELELVASNTYGSDSRGSEMAAAVGLLPRHAAELGVLLTHRFALRDVASALACASDRGAGAIKVSVLAR